MKKYVIIYNHQIYAVELAYGITIWRESLKLDYEVWQKISKEKSVQGLLRNGIITVGEPMCGSLDGLSLEQAKTAITHCDDAVELRRWFLDSKPDRTDWGKAVRYYIQQRLGTIPGFKWQQGDTIDLYDEIDWRPRDIGKIDREAEHKQAMDSYRDFSDF